jgi:hypothetical protein
MGWGIFILAAISIVFVIASFYIIRQKDFTPEQLSIQVGMILLKAIVQVAQPLRPTHIFLYTFGFLTQVLSFQWIVSE